VPIRPTCAFFRPGVLVAVRLPARPADAEQEEGEAVLGVVQTFRPRMGRYSMALGVPRRLALTPYEIDAGVILHGTEVICRVEGLRVPRSSSSAWWWRELELLRADGVTGGRVMRAPSEAEEEGASLIIEEEALQGAELLGRLEYQHTETMGHLPRGCIGVRMARVRVPDGVCAVDLLASASHGDTAREHLDGRLAPFLCVHISGVVRVATDADVARADLLVQCRFLQQEEEEEEAAAEEEEERDDDSTSQNA